MDDSRIEEFLSRQKPDSREDWLYASELLGWRAIVTGEYLSELIQLQHLVPETEERMTTGWPGFTAGNAHPKLVDLLRNLDTELLRAGVASYLLSRMYRDTYFDLESDFKIPTDGDLRAYAWAVPINDSPGFESWAKLLGYSSRDRSDQPFCRELVEVVKLAAFHTVAGGGSGDHVTATGGLDNDLLQNTHDMLWVTSQLIEQALPPTPEHVRNQLISLLGNDVLGRLDPHARQTLIDAEWIFRTGGSPMASLREIAQAFEHHVRARIVPLLPVSFPGVGHRSVWNPGLADIEHAVGRCCQSEHDSLKRAGLDPAEVATAIDRVRKRQGEWKHNPKRARLSREEAREIREAWYGLKPGEPGVFHLITGVHTA